MTNNREQYTLINNSRSDFSKRNSNSCKLYLLGSNIWLAITIQVFGYLAMNKNT